MPKKSIPNKITIQDELGQNWHVDNQDDLWADVLALTKNGTEPATLPMSVILSRRGWGWWSCFKTQDDWLNNIGIPIPGHDVLNEIDENNLGTMLLRFGGYITFLETQLGLLAGRRNALKEAYAAAVAVHTADIDKGSEKAKEAHVLSESETLRQTKRLFIETDMLYETAKGMTGSYIRAFDTVSRLVTIQVSEREMNRRTL